MIMLQKLKAIIQKSVPEIMELGFGCEVEIDIFTEKVWKLCVIDDRSLIVKPFGVKDVDIDMQKVDIKHITKILGRPITLADVMLTILEPKNKKSREKKWSNLEKFLNPYIHWNLKDNNLDHQSKECIDFLYNLLK